MNKPITEEDLHNDFSSIEVLIKEWETLYPELTSSQKSKEEDVYSPLVEPVFIYKIHAST